MDCSSDQIDLLATGLGQLGFTIVIGFARIVALGKGWMEALYVAVALTFTSTIIIVKLLSDKRELDSLHGRIAVGFPIVQDVAVVIAMVAMSALRGLSERDSAGAWQVMPLWQPQFLNRTHRLRVLDDPRGALGGADDAVIVTSRAATEQMPAAVLGAIRKVRLDVDAVTEMDLAVNVQGQTARAAAASWLSRNPATLATWLA